MLLFQLLREASRFLHSRLIQTDFFCRARDRMLRAVLAQLVKSFEDQGIPYWVTGGVAYDSFPEIPVKHHKDLDVIVAAEDMERVRKVLRELRGKNIQEITPLFYSAELRGERVEFFAFTRTGSRVLSGSVSLDVLYPYRFLEEKVRRESKGLHFYSPSDEGLCFFAWVKSPGNAEIQKLIEKKGLRVSRSAPVKTLIRAE